MPQETTQANWLPNTANHHNSEFEFGCYQPLTFTAKQGINPLVTASAALLSLASQLHLQSDYEDTHTLHEHLVYELRAFTTSAKQLGISSDIIQAARYSLCALFDEMILNSAWGNETNWGQYRLLAKFEQAEQADEQFYAMLNKLCTDPTTYIDIIELMYLCLSIGFVGKYRFSDDGVAKRSELMDRLYHLIRMQRGEFSKKLSLPPPPAEYQRKTKVFTPWRSLIITSVVLVGLCFGFNFLIQNNSTSLKHNLSQIINRNAQ